MADDPDGRVELRCNVKEVFIAAALAIVMLVSIAVMTPTVTDVGIPIVKWVGETTGSRELAVLAIAVITSIPALIVILPVLWLAHRWL